jgi:hypothetical protein
MSQLLNVGNSITAGTDPYQFYNFRERVLSDGATILSDTQVSEEIKRLRALGLFSKFSALYTPAVRNTGKLYSLISPDGDASVTRGSVKNINSASGALEQIASNVTPSSFGTGGWGALVEGGATNLIQHTNNIENSVWTKTGVTPVNTTDALLGTGSIITESTANERHFFRYSVSAYTGDNRFLQIIIKPVAGTGVRYVWLSSVASNVNPLTSDGGLRIGAIFDLQTETFTAVTNANTITHFAKLDNGTYVIGLFNATDSGSAAGNRGIAFGFANAPDDALSDYTGIGRQCFVSFCNGFQGTGSPRGITSPISNDGTPDTRSADAIEDTGAPELATGGLYAIADLRLLSQTRTIKASGTNASNGYFLLVTSTNRIRMEVRVAGVVTGSVETGTITAGLRKVAGLWAPSGIALYVDGVAIGTAVPSSLPASTATTSIGSDFGAVALNDRLVLCGVINDGLTNSQAIALTT